MKEEAQAVAECAVFVGIREIGTVFLLSNIFTAPT
jgi:hypothetical protein